MGRPGRKRAEHDEFGKVCNSCSTYKLYEEFYNNKNAWDGRSTYCKKCMQDRNTALRDKDREAYNEYHQKYYQANKEKISKRVAEYRHNNPDKTRAINYKAMGYVPKNPRKHTPGVTDGMNIDGNE